MRMRPSPRVRRTLAIAVFRRPTPLLVLACCSANLDVPLLVEGDGLRALGLVLVLRPAVHAQTPQHLPAQGVVLEHAPDGVLQRPGGVDLPLLAEGASTQPTRIAGVPRVDLPVQL